MLQRNSESLTKPSLGGVQEAMAAAGVTGRVRQGGDGNRLDIRMGYSFAFLLRSPPLDDEATIIPLSSSH